MQKSTEEQTAAQVLDIIKEAEMILVGIGEEVSPAWNGGAVTENGRLRADAAETAAQNGRLRADAAETATQNGQQQTDETRTQRRRSDFLRDCRLSRFYEEIPPQHEILTAYNRLRVLIGAKPYFVVTLNTDDLIYRSELEDDLIVAPCGSMGKLQCSEHIVPAGEIRDRVLAEYACAENGKSGDTRSAETRQNAEAVCPICGKALGFHTISNPEYLEEGYLPQWGKYTRWLSCTLNRRLCILELGVGFDYPQVVRFPFEKTAFFNRKATLVRINSKFPHLTEEISQRGISVRENPLNFLNKC